MKKYANSEISTDEFMSKINYIALGSVNKILEQPYERTNEV